MCRQRPETCCRRSQVLPDVRKVLSGAIRCSQTYLKHSYGTPVPVIRDLSYSAGWPECPPTAWYTPDIDTSKFTLHILSDTSAGSQRLKYILLMSELVRSQPPSASLSSLNLPLQLHLHTRSITSLECISEFTGSSFSGASQIALKHRQQPVHIVYRVYMGSYIDT
jgi:hypothetical protein